VAPRVGFGRSGRIFIAKATSCTTVEARGYRPRASPNRLSTSGQLTTFHQASR
jgi:hypothetical protein